MLLNSLNETHTIYRLRLIIRWFIVRSICSSMEYKILFSLTLTHIYLSVFPLNDNASAKTPNFTKVIHYVATVRYVHVFRCIAVAFAIVRVEYNPLGLFLGFNLCQEPVWFQANTARHSIYALVDIVHIMWKCVIKVT